jgi:tetratricopeptide (TPR) repeat protein
VIGLLAAAAVLAALGATVVVVTGDRLRDVLTNDRFHDEVESGSLARPIPTLETRAGVDPLVVASIDEAVAAIERRPEEATLWGELGRLYQATEYHSLARRAYAAAAELAPSDPAWPYYLGVDAARRGEHEEAVRRFRRTLELAPGYSTALLRLGEVLLATDELAAAEEAFAEHVAREPDAPWGHLGLGRVARRQGRLGEASRHLERALERLPGERKATYLLAMTYRELGRTTEAESLLAGLSSGEQSPTDPLLAEVARRAPGQQALVRRANDRLAAGDLDGAATLYRQVLEVDSEHYTALVNLGNLYGRQGQSEEALALLRRAVEIDPDNPHGRYGLALALLSRGRTGAARRELETVLRLDPSHPHAAQLLARLGR